MGFHASWAAARAQQDAVIVAGGFVDTGEVVEPGDVGLYAVEPPGGWVVLFGDGWDAMERITPELAARLGRAFGEAVFFSTDDTSMCAIATGYTDGAARWSVVYDGSKGISRPVVEGDAPGQLAEIVAVCERQQKGVADCDYMYEIPTELARVLVGFRHDRMELSQRVIEPK
jgi:hypothetical protein